MQGLLQWYNQQVNLGAINRLEAFLEPISLRRASTVTTESAFARNWLRTRYPHLDVRQAEHAPNWLFHRVARRPATKPLEFLFVGVISQIKGTDLLLSALDALRDELDFHLTLVGSSTPQFLQRIKAASSSALWERLRVRQALTPSQVGEELARATMMLFPSRADTSPNAVKEAVVAGVPVVASAVGGIPDYVLPGRNGITFPAANVDALIDAIRAATCHPLFSKGKVDLGVLDRMRNYLSPRLMGERFLEAYWSVSGHASRR
jgi:glycosyltransferase involved in cell wall biosynthesis